MCCYFGVRVGVTVRVGLAAPSVLVIVGVALLGVFVTPPAVGVAVGDLMTGLPPVGVRVGVFTRVLVGSGVAVGWGRTRSG